MVAWVWVNARFHDNTMPAPFLLILSEGLAGINFQPGLEGCRIGMGGKAAG